MIQLRRVRTNRQKAMRIAKRLLAMTEVKQRMVEHMIEKLELLVSRTRLSLNIAGAKWL
jgi:hypothetical protein